MSGISHQMGPRAKIRFKKCVDYDTFYSGSHLSTPNAQAYSSGNDGQREAAQADQDAYP